MKFVADDDRFGIVVTPAGCRHMYQFRLVIDGRLIGDAEPCIITSAIMRLGDLKTLSDPRLSLGLSDPAALVRLVASIGGLDIESGEEPDSGGSASTVAAPCHRVSWWPSQPADQILAGFAGDA